LYLYPSPRDDSAPAALPFPTRRSSDLKSKQMIAPRKYIRFSFLGRENHSILPAYIPSKNMGAMVKGRRSRIMPNFSSSNLSNIRSEEHTSELQSRFDIVCRLLLENKNT